ncbi:MAG TPA: glycosyltransferase family 9 protein [Bryobacteraceae bacterium]|nr:glycosyltransferase family 9 protein [Bryobacteraceae bacterium]
MRRLLIRPGAIGDFILSLPAMEHLRAAYTEVWASSPNLPLARFADRTRSIASTGLDLLGIPDVEPPGKLIDDLRSFDSIVSWYGANRTEFREAVERLGLPVQFLAALPETGSRLHATDFYLQQVSGAPGAVPRLPCPRGDGGYAAIHPFSGSPRKNWPLDRFLELTRLLEPLMPVLWILEPGSAGIDGARLAPPIEDLYGLACWLARARFYVGNDSGITHLAAAAGVEVLALHGPTDPAIWAPRGPHVRVIAPGQPGGPMTAIPLEGVLAAIPGNRPG